MNGPCRRKRAGALLGRLCVVAAVIGWSATAKAYMGYPVVVDTWLGTAGLDEMIEPPMGCQLCHVSDQGGTVELKPFGNLLVATYGLPKTAEEDAALMGVLAGVKAANPTLFKDMQKGIDPNGDPALTAQELPQPEYGCSTAGRTAGGGAPWLAVLFATVPLAGALRRSRRARRR
jgi:hypothetical protein